MVVPGSPDAKVRPGPVAQYGRASAGLWGREPACRGPRGCGACYMDRMVHIISDMTRGRPLEFDPENAVDAAMDVFWCKGYEATSLNDLLHAMDLSKSSFYQAFGSKPQLFKRCLLRYQERFTGELGGNLKRARSGRRFIEDVFRFVANTAQEPAGAKGCLVGNSANEFGQRDAVFAKPVAQGLRGLGDLFKAALKRAQSEGDVAADVDINAMASYLVSAMTGLRTIIKSGLDKRTAQSMVPLILAAVK